MVTTDNSIAYQQNLKGRRIAIVVLSRNRWSLVEKMIPNIIAAVNGATPGSYAVVEIPLR